MKKPQIVISISGGVLTDVVSDQPIDILLVDWDNIKGGDTEPLDAIPNYPATFLNAQDFKIARSKIVDEANQVIQKNIDEMEKASAGS